MDLSSSHLSRCAAAKSICVILMSLFEGLLVPISILLGQSFINMLHASLAEILKKIDDSQFSISVLALTNSGIFLPSDYNVTAKKIPTHLVIISRT
jgi:hypothetical protein